MSPNIIQLTKHCDYRSRHHSLDDLTVIGSAALVAPATAGSTNSARTISAHLLTSSHPAWSHWSDATVLDDYAMTTTTRTHLFALLSTLLICHTSLTNKL